MKKTHIIYYVLLTLFLTTCTLLQEYDENKKPAPPQAVEAVRLQEVLTTSAVLSWEKTADTTGYRVSIYENQETLVYVIDVEHTTVTITGLKPATVYSVEIRSYNPQTTAPPSNTVILQTLDPGAFDTIAFTSFMFERDKNPGCNLTNDINGIINNTTREITLTVPHNTDLTLIATFTTTSPFKNPVSLNTTVQISAETENTFDAPLDYVIKSGEGKEPVTYRVSVIKAADTPPRVDNLHIDGKTKVNSRIRAVYDYHDQENDPEGDSIIHWYTTTRDGPDTTYRQITDTTGDTLLLTTAYGGYSVKFRVYPAEERLPIDTTNYYESEPVVIRTYPDYTDPSLFSVHRDTFIDFDVNDTVLCALSGKFLYLYDLSGSSSYSLLGMLDTGLTGCHDLCLNGDRALITGTDGIAIISITDPRTPVLTKTITTATDELPITMREANNHLFFLTRLTNGTASRLYIIDPAAPDDSPSITLDPVGDMCLDTDALYMATTKGTIEIITLDDLITGNHTNRESITLTGAPLTGIVIRNKKIIAYNNKNLYHIDVGGGTSPIINSIPHTEETIKGVWYEGDALHIISHDGLVNNYYRVDTGDLPALTTPIPFQNIIFRAYDPVQFEMHDSTILILTENHPVIDGIYVLDTTGADYAPTTIINRQFDPISVTSYGDFLLVLDKVNGLLVPDLTVNGTFITRQRIDGIPAAFDVRGNRAYIAADTGIHCFDITNISDIKPLDCFGETMSFTAVHAVGDSVYGVTGSDNRLSLYTVEDMNTPVTTFALPAQPTAIRSENSSLYLTFSHDQIMVIDITQPTAPYITTSYHSIKPFYDLDIHGATLHLAGDEITMLEHTATGLSERDSITQACNRISVSEDGYFGYTYTSWTDRFSVFDLYPDDKRTTPLCDYDIPDLLDYCIAHGKIYIVQKDTGIMVIDSR